VSIPIIWRGDVFDIDIPVIGPHPGVVVTLGELIPVRTNVTIALVTSTPRHHRTQVPVNAEAGLDRPSVVDCCEIYTVPKRALTRKRGALRFEDLLRVDRALRVALGLVTDTQVTDIRCRLGLPSPPAPNCPSSSSPTSDQHALVLQWSGGTPTLIGAIAGWSRSTVRRSPPISSSS
jgi:mRNA interferase MazF